ncbi:hypothetical protein [Tritonibacter mobilis]|uniref:hypothetical protein n=1 Tax=Tritonibacter mobilis TaxID=379347 RepID=UPI000806EDA5|nr:hypothetical protein [Tritonibacter mobilis]
MHVQNKLKAGVLKAGAAASAALALTSTSAMAAGSDTGVEAGFFAMATDLSTILGGAGGYLVLIISVAIAAITLAVTGRWTNVAVALGVSMFLGYGVTTLTSLGGVTASTDLLAQTSIDATASQATTL